MNIKFLFSLLKYGMSEGSFRDFMSSKIVEGHWVELYIFVEGMFRNNFLDTLYISIITVTLKCSILTIVLEQTTLSMSEGSFFPWT